MAPESLGKLTYGEFLELYEGFKWREKKQREEYAILASWLTAPHYKNPVQPSDYMKTFEDKEKKTVTKEEKERVTREIEERLGVI